MKMCHHEIAEAAEFLKEKLLKEKFKIVRFQTDCIHRIEAVCARECNDIYKNHVYFNILLIDDNDMTIDSLDNDEISVLASMLEKCKTSSLYILCGHRGTSVKKLILAKGTTLEQLLAEKDLKLDTFA